MKRMENQASHQTRGRGRAARAASAGAGLLLLAAVAAAAIALSGCASFQAWGQKSSGSPASMGGAFNIPLGK